MRRYRAWFAAVTAAVLLVVLPAPEAEASLLQIGGRILYLEFSGWTGDMGALKSVRPNGQGGQDFGRQLWWYAYPDYSPDGTRIAYMDGWDFRSMAADGSDDR